jgi:hypothetical protein
MKLQIVRVEVVGQKVVRRDYVLFVALEDKVYHLG